MARERARVGGSGLTIIHIGSTPVTFARQVSDQAPTPVGSGTVPIHPMDERHPVELITPQAATMGTLTLEFYDIVGSRFWDRIPGLKGAVDLVDVFERVAKLSNGLSVTKYIASPATAKNASQNNNASIYRYNNCVVSQIVDSESIEVGTMEVLKQIVLNYTHVTREGGTKTGK